MKRRGFLAALLALPFVGALRGARDRIAASNQPEAPTIQIWPLDCIRPGTYDVIRFGDQLPHAAAMDVYMPLGQIYVFNGYALVNPSNLWRDPKFADCPWRVLMKELELKPGEWNREVRSQPVLPASWLS